ncbi:MAG: hypothetical protein ABFS12_13745 [Bacteroidota bacterium]
MQKTLLLLTLFLLGTSQVYSQNMIDRTKLKSEYALKQNRSEYIQALKNKIQTIFDQKLSSANEKEWRSLFREIGLIFYKSDKVYRAIQEAILYSPSASLKFKRSIVETILILYPKEFSDFIENEWRTTVDPTLFAYTSQYMLNQNESITTRKRISNALITRFKNWESISQLKFLNYYLMNKDTVTPVLREVLHHPFMTGKTIIFSLHRKNRSYAGITIIRKPNGSFVKDENDSIFYIKQLAKSVSGLPGYLSQGDTPQGVFSIVGFYVSPTPSIGPTANVLTRIPYEVPTKLFYHGAIKDKKWKLEDYKNLLPSSWRNYLPIYESFYAGKTGRRKIVMHGSVDDLNFYKDETYFPLTPSKGCLTSKEIWSEKTGKNIESDQTKLMNAFFSTGEIEGFLVVINIDDKEKDVSIEEILPFIDN